MAVQSDTSRIQYAGNNSTTTSYAVPFVFQENSHLKAIARTSAGVESVVTLTNHTGAGNVNGGTVRTAVAVPATSTLTIYREVPATQTTTYAEGGDFPAASHERALDKLTQIAQQNQRQIGASLRLTEANQIAALPLPTAAGQHVLATAGSGTAPSFQSLGSLSIGPVVATGSTTPRSVQDRFADMANVADFGAVGGATNDIAAFVAASDTGKHVYVPSGTYTITVSTQAEATSIMSMMSRLHLFCTSLTVNFNTGTYTFTDRTEFLVTNGDRLQINGAATTAFTYSSLVSVVSNAVGDHDVTIALADATNINTNDYIVIRPTNSAVDFAGPFCGIWRVTGKLGNNITYKNTARVASLSAATITGTSATPVRIARLNTILHYNNGTIGLYIRNQLGAVSSNTIGLKNIAVVGSGTGSDSIGGVYLEYGASINLNSEFGIYNFAGNGIYAIYQGLVNASNICISNCGASGVYALAGSVIQIVRAQCTGNGNYGIVGSTNSVIAGSQSNASGNVSGYGSVDNSNVTCNTSTAFFNQNYGYTCRSVSFCDALNSKSEYNQFGVEALENSYINFAGTSTVANNTTYNFREEDGTCYIQGAVLPTRSRASIVHNFGTISANTVATATITVSGALLGDVVAIGWNGSDVSGAIITARVSASNTVTIYAANVTTSSITVGNRTYWIRVFNK